MRNDDPAKQRIEQIVSIIRAELCSDESRSRLIIVNKLTNERQKLARIADLTATQHNRAQVALSATQPIQKNASANETALTAATMSFPISAERVWSWADQLTQSISHQMKIPEPLLCTLSVFIQQLNENPTTLFNLLRYSKSTGNNVGENSLWLLCYALMQTTEIKHWSELRFLSTLLSFFVERLKKNPTELFELFYTSPPSGDTAGMSGIWQLSYALRMTVHYQQDDATQLLHRLFFSIIESIKENPAKLFELLHSSQRIGNQAGKNCIWVLSSGLKELVILKRSDLAELFYELLSFIAKQFKRISASLSELFCSSPSTGKSAGTSSMSMLKSAENNAKKSNQHDTARLLSELISLITQVQSTTTMSSSAMFATTTTTTAAAATATEPEPALCFHTPRE